MYTRTQPTIAPKLVNFAVIRISLLIAALLLPNAPLLAQEPEPASAGGDASATPSDAPKAPAVPGDVLVLKSGTQMTGVQVLRETPQFYEVEVVKGVKIQVPRRQVESVIYDDVDPTRDARMKELFPEQQEVTIESGERVTRGLSDKLTAPVSTEPLNYQDKDFVEILNELKTKLGLNLKIDQAILDRHPRTGNWTVKTDPSRTLLAFLREDLAKKFNYLTVTFEGDKILIKAKEPAQNENAGADLSALPANPFKR